MCICLICQTTIAIPKKGNVERHFQTDVLNSLWAVHHCSVGPPSTTSLGLFTAWLLCRSPLLLWSLLVRDLVILKVARKLKKCGHPCSPMSLLATRMFRTPQTL